MGRNALLAVLFALLAGCGEPSPGAAASAPRPTTAPATPRLLVVGWDGASFRAIDPLLAEGKLPHLSGLIARGTRGVIESTIIPISSAAWTTATTGMGPGVHGVFAFHEPVQGSYDLALVSSRSNRSAPLWRLLTGRGIPSLVFGVPLTYPPEPILGTMVCGMLAPRTAVYTWPAALTESLRARGFQPDLDPWLEEREPTLDEAREQLDVREQILGELLARDDWRLAWIVFKELDVLSHYSYGVDFDAHVGPVYERLDALLGRLVAAVGADTNVILLSDHGFRSYTRGFNLHAWLMAEGFAVLRADATPEAELEPLPEGPFARRFAAESKQRLDALDLGRTSAYSWACEGNFGSVRLNLRGREPRGSVDPENAGDVLVRIEARLFANPLVKSVWRGEDLLPGPERASLPDVLFETQPDVQVFAERGSEVSGRYDPSVADHDLHGIFVAGGPAIARAELERPLRLLDVAPLALHLLGQPVPLEMQGEVPLALLNDRRPPARVPGASFAVAAPPRSGEVYTQEEIEELEKELGALGYGD
jgi:predicted AlkP superfamily phosphohydrolase/phosphomutase